MADIRINSLPTTASASSSDDFLALDGATNGTRKLNAYSPTFGGNLTVSGTTGTIGSNSGFTWDLGSGINFIALSTGRPTITAAVASGNNAGAALSLLARGGGSRRTWNLETDTTEAGDCVLRQSTTEAGSTFTNALYFSAARNATLSGNLTVSGTGGIQLNSFANLTWGGAYGAGIPTIAIPSATSIGFYPTGSTSGKTFELFGTGNATLTGNLTVSGTAATLDSTADGVGFRGTSGGNNRFSLIRYDTLSSGSVLLSAFGEVDLMYGATTTATSGTVGARLTTLGNFIIGSTGADGGQKLQVNGTAAIAGTATATRLIANSQWVAASAGTGALSATANAGVQLTGTGAVNDITLVNKNGDNVMVVPTGTTNATFAGAIAIGNTVNTVSPTSPNRTITMVIGGTTYYIHAKTTND